MPSICRIGDPFTCGDTEGHGSPNVFANNIPATRINVDKTNGHSCFPPVVVVSGSPNVFINNIETARVGDPHEGHCCVSCHGGNVQSGSPNVFVNS
jgi:uncharacterized Zn-binding protein involved in type VI secretion